MSVFKSEAAMQSWLSKEFSEGISIAELIINIDETENAETSSIPEKLVLDNYLYCIESLYMHNTIAENENISLKSDDILRPDFLLYAPETQSIIIVEVKNIINPTRQAGTEISAYANEVKSYVPFISEGDIISVIISAEWPTLLKHYIFHEIFWLQKNIICLEPIKQNEEIRLKIKSVAEISIDDVLFKISDNHIGGYNLCLYDMEMYSTNPKPGRLDKHVEQMKAALYSMSIKGNSHKNSGFAFLWKDIHPQSLSPYFVTIANIAPMQSIERFFHQEGFQPSVVMDKFVDLIVQQNPIGHGNSLGSIVNQGKKFLDSFCSPRLEGFLPWYILKEEMLRRGDFIYFQSWGMFSEIYDKILMEEYNQGNTGFGFNECILGLKVLDEIIDKHYEFIDLSSYNYKKEEE